MHSLFLPYRADVDCWADKIGTLCSRNGRRQNGAVVFFYTAVVVASHLSNEKRQTKKIKSFLNIIYNIPLCKEDLSSLSSSLFP